MTRAIVLGAGRVGQAIVHDLSQEEGWEVTVADRSEAALAAVRERTGASVRADDLSDPEAVGELVRGFDLAVGALPSFLGFRALRAVIREEVPYVDISFFEEDPFDLDALARDHGTVAVVDCGVAPGLDNVLLGHLLEELDEVHRFVCLVGGLPETRTLPWEYKAPFAPYDVLNEYTRPARYVAAGRQVTVPALSGLEHYDFPGVGTLEGFLTDGLRTLLHTVEVPWMEERTLRYPGHAEKILLLRESGLLDTGPVEISGSRVSPLAVTSTQLFPHWELADEEVDLTVMRVVVEGRRGYGWERHVFGLLDRRDPETGISSMARTTGFTCAAVARLVAAGVVERQGVLAPEHVGGIPDAWARLAADLEARDVRLHHRVEPMEKPGS